MVRKKQKTKNNFPFIAPFFPCSTSLHSQLFYNLPCQAAQRGMTNGRLWSVNDTSTFPVLPPHTFPLLQHGSPIVCNPCQTTCSSICSSPWIAVSARSLFLCRFSMGCCFLLDRSTHRVAWSSMGCHVNICFMSFGGNKLVFSMGCRGISALVPGASLPPSSLTLVSAGLFLSRFCHSSVSQLAQCFISLP